MKKKPLTMLERCEKPKAFCTDDFNMTGLCPPAKVIRMLTKKKLKKKTQYLHASRSAAQDLFLSVAFLLPQQTVSMHRQQQQRSVAAPEVRGGLASAVHLQVRKTQKTERRYERKKRHRLPLATAVDGLAATPFIDTTPSCFTRPSVIAICLSGTHTYTHTTHTAGSVCCPMFPLRSGDLDLVTFSLQSRPFNSYTPCEPSARTLALETPVDCLHGETGVCF